MRTSPPTRLQKFFSQAALLILFLAYWYFAYKLERIDYSLAMPPITQTIRNFFALLGPFVLLFDLVAEFFSWSVLRHLFAPLIGWHLARQATLNMLQSFYDLPDSDAANALLFRLSTGRLGFARPTIVSLQTFEEARHNDPILKIGGPGRIVVFSGAALVTELNGRFHRVLGPGRHLLERFEFPRTLVDLRPQERESDDVKLMTSDGIELSTTLTVTFQIDQGKETPTKQNPFPFNPEAVRAAAYTETVQPDGSIGRWDSLPLLITAGQLGFIVAEDRLDELVQSESNGIDVHRRLQTEMERRAKASLRNFGITLRGTRLGALELPEVVEEQRKRYWEARWDTERTKQQADGEAEVLQSREIVRAEAEAIMLQAIAEGLQRSGRAGRNISSREVVALRLIESLEAMAKKSSQVMPLPDQLIHQLVGLRQQVMLTSRTTEEAESQE